jgi:hypothetical protein
VKELLLCEHDGWLGIGDQDKHVAVQAELVDPVVYNKHRMTAELEFMVNFFPSEI